MNRIQFFVLTGLSSLVLLLLIAHIFLVRATNAQQNRAAVAQQIVNQAQAFGGNLKQLAVRIYQDAQKTQDPGLKELLERQQIKFTPNTNAEPEATPAPAAAH